MKAKVFVMKKEVQATLTLMRHGEATNNRDQTLAGWRDVELTARGIMQAKCIGKSLSGRHFDLAYTSTSSRAKETLRIAIESGGISVADIIETRALLGADSGIWEGRAVDDIIDEVGIEEFDRLSNSLDEGPPNGESMGNVYDRVEKFYAEEVMPALNRNLDVVVSAHTDSLSVLRVLVEGQDKGVVERLKIPNAMLISCVIRAKNPIVAKRNDERHR